MSARPLPRAIAAWSPSLRMLVEDLQAPLAQACAALDEIAAPPRAVVARGGEPDGIGGLARRGAYERLLASEWLLADELPDEFLRRAGSGEHLFLAEEPRSARGARHVLALFDAGPEQVGLPRLAHLALLVVLARRAEESRGSFAWGTLQDAERKLHHGAGPAEIFALLAARSARRPSQDDAAAWDERLASLPPSERWLVAPRATAQRMKPAASCVVVDVEEPLELVPRALAVRRLRGHVVDREASVPLPPAAVSARLLTRPLAAHVAYSGHLTDIVIGANGVHAFVVDAEGGIIACPLAHDERKRPPRRIAPLQRGAKPLAVGQSSRGSIEALWLVDGEAWASHHQRGGDGLVGTRRRLTADAETLALLQAGASRVRELSGEYHLAWMCTGGVLLSTNGDKLLIAKRGVLAATVRKSVLMSVSASPERGFELATWHRSYGEMHDSLVQSDPGLRPVAAVIGGTAHRVAVALALRDGDEWLVRASDVAHLAEVATRRATAPVRDVVGCTTTPRGEAALLVLTDGGKQLSRVATVPLDRPAGRESPVVDAFPAPAALHAVTVSTHAPFAAAITCAGDVIAWSIGKRKLMRQWGAELLERLR